MGYTKFNIAKPIEYEKDGQQKTFWANVGTMTEFVKQDGSVSRIMEIHAIGLKANIFPIEPKQDGGGYQNNQESKVKQSMRAQGSEQAPPQTPPEEEVKVEDIPF